MPTKKINHSRAGRRARRTRGRLPYLRGFLCLTSLAIFLLVLAIPDSALASTSSLPVVRCQPVAVGGPVGHNLAIDLYIENASDLYGVDLRLTFDTSVAQVVDMDTGTAGVQIQPLSGFLAPDYVVRRVADNSMGTIWYAVTQTNPRPPAAGSGAVARVTFSAVAPGIFNMPFTSFQLADRNGTVIPATSQDCAVNFWPPITDLTISRSGANAQLSWTHLGTGVAHYELWRMNNKPYFQPGDSGSVQINVPAPASGTTVVYLDSGSALGDTENNSFYVVRAVTAGGQKSGISNRVGEFDYALAYGRYSTIALPLTGSGLTNASTLAAHIQSQTGGTVQELLRWDPSITAFRAYQPGSPLSVNFPTAVGDAYQVRMGPAGSGPATILGGVPAQGSISFNLAGASGTCRQNLFSLPLDQEGIVNAAGLYAAIGNVNQLLVWSPSTGVSGTFRIYEPGNPLSTNFATRIGHGYFACMNSSKVWP
jgi:hypothetical protein